MAALPERRDIDPKYQWDLSHIFASAADWAQAADEAEKAVKRFSAWSGRVAEDPAAVIRGYFELQDQLTPVIEYAFLASEVEKGDPEVQARYDRAMGLITLAASSSAFMEPELLALKEDVLESLRRDPAMADYDEYLRNLSRQKQHTLSAAEERLIASLGELTAAPHNIYSMLTAVNMKFEDMVLPDGTRQPLSDSTWDSFREHEDRALRQQSFEKIMGGYGAMGETIAAAYIASVKKDCALARARHYDNSLTAAMDPLEIPRSVYENLIQTIRQAIPTLQRYLTLRKEMLGLDELHMYDLYCPLVKDDSMSMPYEKAFDLVLAGLEPMGKDYLDKLREARTGGWIDVYPAKGKTSGAFSAGSLRHVHPYVLLNHAGTLDSAFTIAHELGHAMHSYYSNTNQPLPKADYSLFVAEVASICNEAIMLRYLLREFPQPASKAYLLNHFLEQFRTTGFRQTMFAEFELKAHELAECGAPLTRQTLSQVYHQLNEDYYAPACTVDSFIDNEWMRIPHFYNAFYVYVYATGLCAAVTLSDRILTEGEKAIADYRRFLSAGCSVPPIEALKLAGIDMSSPEPIQRAMQVFSQTLDQFADAVKKL